MLATKRELLRLKTLLQMELSAPGTQVRSLQSSCMHFGSTLHGAAMMTKLLEPKLNCMTAQCGLVMQQCSALCGHNVSMPVSPAVVCAGNETGARILHSGRVER